MRLLEASGFVPKVANVRMVKSEYDMDFIILYWLDLCIYAIIYHGPMMMMLIMLLTMTMIRLSFYISCSLYASVSNLHHLSNNLNRVVFYYRNLAKKCACPVGTFGLHCEFSQYEECSLQCFNGGKCKIGLKDFTHMKEYGLDIEHYLGGRDEYGEHCVCPEGFSGAKCEVDDVVICGQGICFNGASCVQTVSLDGTEVYNEYCRCKHDDAGVQFAGKFCEHESTTKCPAPYGHNPDEYFCTNGGECADEP